MAGEWGCNKCGELHETMELAQACHPGADVIGPLRSRRLRVRQGSPGRLDVEPDPEREALEVEVRALREALLNIQTRAGGYIAPGEAEPQRLLRLIRQWASHALAPEPPGRA